MRLSPRHGRAGDLPINSSTVQSAKGLRTTAPPSWGTSMGVGPGSLLSGWRSASPAWVRRALRWVTPYILHACSVNSRATVPHRLNLTCESALTCWLKE